MYVLPQFVIYVMMKSFCPFLCSTVSIRVQFVNHFPIIIWEDDVIFPRLTFLQSKLSEWSMLGFHFPLIFPACSSFIFQLFSHLALRHHDSVQFFHVNTSRYNFNIQTNMNKSKFRKQIFCYLTDGQILLRA